MLATAFLTRCPVAAPADALESEDEAERPRAAVPLARASALFPVVGLGVGVAAALVMIAGYHLGLHPLVCALLAVATLALLTGALHEDGLADFADGLWAGTTPEERLAIMRDSHLGTYGTLALIFSVCLRATLLSQLTSIETASAALIAAAALSRGLLPAVMCALDPARPDGLAAAAGRPSSEEAAAALAIGAIVVLLSLTIGAAVVACLAAAMGAVAVAALARWRLGGQTGDVLGTAQQTAEVMIYLAIAAAE